MEAADFELLQVTDKFNDQRSVKDFFASCWTTDQLLENSLLSDYSVPLANAELKKDGSASMWEDYCKSGGIRVATTLGKLLSLFNASSPNDQEVYYGSVEYMAAQDHNRFKNMQNIVNTLFHKRVGFRHETEFRFVGDFSYRDQDFIKVPIPDYYDFLDEILVSPVKNSKQNHRAKLLHDLGVCLSSNKQGTNFKNGKQFCRVSQLYGIVSNEIGSVQLLER
jgi:hypothetical protein